jgi:hypothetical protein
MNREQLIEKIYSVVEPHYNRAALKLIVRLIEDECHLVRKDAVEVVEGLRLRYDHEVDGYVESGKPALTKEMIL